MRIIARVVLCVAIVVALFMPGSSLKSHAFDPQDQKKNQDDKDAVRLNATLVQVPAVVTDKAGRLIADLSQADFSLFEDGKRQDIAIFTPVKQPFSAVMILDTSNSAQDRLQAIQSTAIGFSRQLVAGDRMMVISFDNEVRQLTDFTSDQKELEAAIRGTESGFGKLLYEAVTRGLEQLREKEGRRAIILFTDGVDMRSIEATAESATGLAEEIGAVIYIVRFDTRWWIEADARKHQAEQSKSQLPFEVDGRIPLPPDFGGPDPSSPEIPKPKAPRIEIGQGGADQPRVTYPDAMGNRRAMSNARPDPLTENLDKIYGEAESFMQTLASRTGGRVFDAATFENTRSAFATIADELRMQYMIGYYPANNRGDGKFHKIKLEVTRKGLSVRARSGYRSAGSGR